MLKNVFVWENKSLANVGEFVKSWTAVEKYVCLQILLRMFPLGIPILLFEEKLRRAILRSPEIMCTPGDP